MGSCVNVGQNTKSHGTYQSSKVGLQNCSHIGRIRHGSIIRGRKNDCPQRGGGSVFCEEDGVRSALQWSTSLCNINKFAPPDPARRSGHASHRRISHTLLPFSSTAQVCVCVCICVYILRVQLQAPRQYIQILEVFPFPSEHSLM